MTATSRAIRWARRTLLVLAGGMALALAGCNSATETAAEPPTAQAADDASRDGERSEEADPDFDDGDVTVDTGNGSVSVGRDLPEDFPDEVPLVDGEVVSATAVDEGDVFGWVVQIENRDEGAYDRAVEEVRAAGFAARDGGSAASAGALTMTVLVNQDWQVSLGRLGNQGVISYTVTALEG